MDAALLEHAGTIDAGSMLLIGSWVLTFTLAILCIQIYQYFSKHSARDHVLLKSLVLLCFAIEVGTTLMFDVEGYHVLLRKLDGSPESLMASVIPSMEIMVIPILCNVTVISVNLYLTWRYWRLCKQIYICIAVGVTALGASLCTLWASSAHIRMVHVGFHNLSQIMALNKQAVLLTKVGLSLELVSVSVINILLLAYLISCLRKDINSMKQVIVRLLVISIETGTATTALATTQLIYYLHDVNSSNVLIIGICSSRCYFMAMLFTFNMRSSNMTTVHVTDSLRLNTFFSGGSQSAGGRSANRQSGTAHNNIDDDGKLTRTPSGAAIVSMPPDWKSGSIITNDEKRHSNKLEV